MKQFFTALFIFSSFLATAQTWQWGKRGGGSANGLNVQPEENIIDMATDPRGNVYALAIIEAQGLPTFTGGTFTTYGNRDIALISYRCDGTFRWRKTIGGGDQDGGRAIGLDTLGHLYVTGYNFNPGSPPLAQVTFEGDMTIPYSNTKWYFVAQYDTSGNLNWLRQPRPDTASAVDNQYWQIYEMTVDKAGDAYCLAHLRPGLIGGSTQVVSSAGMYMMRYNTSGTLVSLTPLQMSQTVGATQFGSLRMNRTPSGKFILAGSFDPISSPVNSFTLGSQPHTQVLFLACFSAQGSLLWKRQNTDSASGFTGKPSLDGQGNIYLAGVARHGAQFNGVTYNNSLTTIQYGFPVATKLDSVGNTIWSVNGSTHDAACLTYDGTLAGGQFVLTGAYAGRLTFPGVSKTLSHAANTTGFDPYLVRIDAQSGQPLFLDSLAASGLNDFGFVLASDKSGNIYLGGRFQTNISIAGATYTSTGGASDFFIARYGAAICNCTVPTSAYTKTQNNATRTATFTYSGPTIGLDSLVWQWGDGQKQKVTAGYGTAIAHTYTGSTTSFNACVTVYTACGQNQSCQSVVFTPVSVVSHSLPGNLQIYPNPAGDVLNIDDAEPGTRFSLFSPAGQKVLSGTISGKHHLISLRGLSPGMYSLITINGTGMPGKVTFVKR